MAAKNRVRLTNHISKGNKTQQVTHVAPGRSPPPLSLIRHIRIVVVLKILLPPGVLSAGLESRRVCGSEHPRCRPCSSLAQPKPHSVHHLFPGRGQQGPAQDTSETAATTMKGWGSAGREIGRKQSREGEGRHVSRSLTPNSPF